MSPNKRIFLNIVATYSRSLFALACGLFCGRWTLMALGEVDYGLVGLIGGLTAFISFLNGQLAGATSRFYAFAVGRAKANKNQQEGLEDCRRYFSLAVTIHTIIPVVLICIGYPLGIWAIDNFLVIPKARIEDSILVFRLVCLSCFVGMVLVPYNAMYTAKQYIAELTIYSFITSTLNVVFLYYIVNTPGDWMVAVCAWGCLLAIVPNLIIAVRGVLLFPECRFRWRYSWDFARFKEMALYVGWNLIGGLAWLFKDQGVSVLVNKFYGPSVNAAFQISNTVNGQASSLASSMLGAFTPAITTFYGAGEMEKCRRLAFQSCKFGLLSMLLFMIPLSLELPTVLRLWLVDPPAYATGLCWLTMLMLLVHHSAFGHIIAVQASGKVALYQAVNGSLLLLTLPLAWLAAALGWGVYSVGGAMILAMVLCVAGRVVLSRRIVGMSGRYWLFRIVLPSVFLSIFCGALGYLPRLFMPGGFIRVVVTTLVCEAAFLPLSWFLMLDADEKAYIVDKISRWTKGRK